MCDVKHFIACEGEAYEEWQKEVVSEYLSANYEAGAVQCDVSVSGKNYKILKRERVTAFYDEDGNTLFDVENERLAAEYADRHDECENDCMADEEKNEEDTENESMEENVSDMEETEENTEACEAEGERHEEKHEEPEAVLAGAGDAESKLRAELEKAKQKDFAEPVIGYLIDRCKESESLAKDVCQAHKTWDKCYSYIFDQARKKLSGKSGPVRNDVVYEWAEDYYHLDDKALEEKKAKEEAERKKKAAEQKKNVKEKKAPATPARKEEKKAAESVATPNPEPKPEPKPQSKHKKNELEGQMDLFSLMGM